MKRKETIKCIEKLLKELRERYISDEHRHDELHWDCPECKFRILEGGLIWWLGLEEFAEKLNKK